MLECQLCEGKEVAHHTAVAADRAVAFQPDTVNLANLVSTRDELVGRVIAANLAEWMPEWATFSLHDVLLIVFVHALVGQGALTFVYRFLYSRVC